MEYKDWLASLKEGDEICYQTRWQGHRITRIVKITPTRIIRTEDGKAFRDGYYKVDSWEYFRLEEVTYEIRAAILKRKLVSQLNHVKWAELPFETIKEVCILLSSQGKEQNQTDPEPMD